MHYCFNGGQIHLFCHKKLFVKLNEDFFYVRQLKMCWNRTHIYLQKYWNISIPCSTDTDVKDRCCFNRVMIYLLSLLILFFLPHGHANQVMAQQGSKFMILFEKESNLKEKKKKKQWNQSYSVTGWISGSFIIIQSSYTKQVMFNRKYSKQ